MRTLSLTQPWASLVALGEKKIETRSWPTPWRGLLAIHAAKTFPQDARELTFQWPFRMVLPKHDLYWSDLPLGAVIAVVSLTHVYRIGSPGDAPSNDGRPRPGSLLDPATLSAQERAFGNYTPGRYAWVFGDVLKLPEPIPATGRLGLWEWKIPAELREYLAAQPIVERARVALLREVFA